MLHALGSVPEPRHSSPRTRGPSRSRRAVTRRRLEASRRGRRQPSRLHEPASHRPDRRCVRWEPFVSCPKLIDHPTRGFPRREPTLCLPSQAGPGVRAWLRALRLRADAAEMGGERSFVPLRPDACRPPDRMQARDEVPTCPPPLKFVAPVRRAQPNRHAMGQMVLCPRSLTRAPADCAHRELPDPLSLVEALRHGLIIAHTPVTSLAQTVPFAYQVPFASGSSDRAPSGQVAPPRKTMRGW